jgi:HD-GYP domain-containing protein (c-di-GMP phosphodiesterase class II)
MSPAIIRLDLYRLLLSVSEALDLVSRPLVNHHKQVSYLAFHLGRAAGLTGQELTELTMAAALHDIGGLSLAGRLDVLDFDLAAPERHTLPGYLLLKKFPPFAAIATLTRFHHLPWQEGAGAEYDGQPVPRAAHLLHLADRVAILLRPEEEILGQTAAILEKIEAHSGSKFMPAAVEALREVAGREAFWFDLVAPMVCETVISTQIGTGAEKTTDLHDLAQMFRQLIDFRSHFTATHSSGVAAVAPWIADKAGLSPADCECMKIAGLLHDIGKLVVPQEVLEKSAPLSREDFYSIRKHPYFSQRILSRVAGLEEISQWAAFHHERLDGTGYPFHLDDAHLSTGARLLAVADTFTALTETRPYRASMSGRGTIQIMEGMVRARKLDSSLYGLLHDHADEVDALRADAQQAALAEHRNFLADWAALGPG